MWFAKLMLYSFFCPFIKVWEAFSLLGDKDWAIKLDFSNSLIAGDKLLSLSLSPGVNQKPYRYRYRYRPRCESSIRLPCR